MVCMFRCPMRCSSGRGDRIAWYCISVCAVSFGGGVSSLVLIINRKRMLIAFELVTVNRGHAASSVWQKKPGQSRFLWAFRIVYIPTYCWVGSFCLNGFLFIRTVHFLKVFCSYCLTRHSWWTFNWTPLNFCTFRLIEEKRKWPIKCLNVQSEIQFLYGLD